MTVGDLCLSFVGVVTDERTGEQRASSWTFRQENGADATLEITSNGAKSPPLPLGGIKGVTMRALHGAVFGGVPGGHAERLAQILNDPINLDRTRRNSINDRLARRYAEMESFAAD